MSVSNGSKIFVFILLGIGVGLAALFVYNTVRDAAIGDFYSVVDTFSTTQGDSTAVITTVQIVEIDSLKMLRVCEKLSADIIRGGSVDNAKKRTLIYKCYVKGTQKALTSAQVDELSYTNPMVQNATDSLYFVPKGSVVKVRFSAGYTQPRDRSISVEEFYVKKK